MPIRTQVYCFVLFLAVLLTSSLVQSQAEPEAPAELAAPAAADATPFYVAVGEHFHVPRGQVQELIESGLEPAQVVVTCFIAQQSLRLASDIAADRKTGRSWRSIARASGLGPEQLYYPLPYRNLEPFANVHALYHQKPRSGWTWDSMPLTDAEVEDLVNLRFVSELTGNEAGNAMRLRGQGLDYPTIHRLLDGQRTARVETEAPSAAALRS
jgi:hypothetical protein